MCSICSDYCNHVPIMDREPRRNVEMKSLLDLNTDCLLKIFSFCSELDLQNLCSAHWLLEEAIENHIFYVRSYDLLLCGHRNEPIISTRTQAHLSFANRLKISSNWLSGCYREFQYFHRSKMFPTQLILDKDSLYLSNANYISQHKRLEESEPLQKRYSQEISTSNKTDIARFVKKGDSIFAGRVAGSCFIYEDGYSTEQQLHNTKEYLWTVDFQHDMYATSTDRCGKIWRRSDELGLLGDLDLVSDLRGSYKTLQFNKSGSRLYGGLYDSIGDRRALREIDVECGFESVLNSNTISIYDLKLKDDHVLFTANFDTSFRIYDRRSDKDESIWEDPFDSSFYCLDYDGLYGILCGTKYHSRVNLYDIRVPGKHMQLYFPHFQGKRKGDYRSSSPVYSLACDSRYLFVATDRNVHVLDFKANCAVSRDYSNFVRQI